MTESPTASLKWSAQFAISPSSRKNALPGDKINLPPSALEQLLEASSTAAREFSRRDLPAYDPFNSSTFSAYKRAEAEYEDARQQLPYPLTFRLVNPANGNVVYAGIREFSAEEGEAELSTFLWETLGLKQTDDHVNGDIDNHGLDANDVSTQQITFHAKQLPKGTFVKLRPLEPGYDPEDWKSLLEQHLRQHYTTLTNGEVLVVPGARGLHGVLFSPRCQRSENSTLMISALSVRNSIPHHWHNDPGNVIRPKDTLRFENLVRTVKFWGLLLRPYCKVPSISSTSCAYT